MKNLRRFGPALVLGLTIALAGVSFAQSTKQTTSDDKHSCCSKDSGCCSDSCEMKKQPMKNHATSTDKEGCCGCCADSCHMMKKEGAKNHATSSDKEGCCGDSCHMKGGATATAKVASDKHQCCCCCGESCNMKHMKQTKDMKEKS